MKSISRQKVFLVLFQDCVELLIKFFDFRINVLLEASDPLLSFRDVFLHLLVIGEFS